MRLIYHIVHEATLVEIRKARYIVPKVLENQRTRTPLLVFLDEHSMILHQKITTGSIALEIAVPDNFPLTQHQEQNLSELPIPERFITRIKRLK